MDGGVVFYRHTKNRKTQVIPLCSAMVSILREYLDLCSPAACFKQLYFDFIRVYLKTRNMTNGEGFFA